ncbi:MAG TPA: TIGR03854 family LLM class F420-dependent oxidoreductase [Acidimicrobiales bacterium]|nr:TIGR03854 family LLM class F420-dependent oxidoreductase [Acidimicrobiales bacterium]
MKVRIGYGLGTTTSLDGPRFASLVDGLEAHRFDSLWLSERITGPAPDPIVGLSVAAGRTARLKLGFSVLVLPGRNPVLLAKELATLDVLSQGRLLPAFGLGVADPNEQQAFGVQREERAARFGEALGLVRRLWTEDAVDHDGRFFSYKGISVRPRPVQSPPDVWLGGRAPSELRRVGRVGDGWLPSFTTPEEAAEGRAAIDAAAAEAGRAIDPEHWGALVPYSRGPLPERMAAFLATRRPGRDPAEVVPSGWAALRERLERFCDVGFSKFVLVPTQEPPSWDDELGEAAAEVLPLQGTR